MKTPKQWMDDFDPAWADDLGQPTVLSEERVQMIQDDARKDFEAATDKLRRRLEYVENLIERYAEAGAEEAIDYIRLRNSSGGKPPYIP